MVCKEDVVKWFKGLEGDQRIDLMCSLLDCCLPLELRFLGTYIEFAASKHYVNLQKYKKTANESMFGELKDLCDATVRRKFCIYLALLYSYNRKVATKLFKFLENFELADEKMTTKDEKLSANGVSSPDDNTFLNEMKLLLSMASYHPAFTFQQKQNLRKKLNPASIPPKKTSVDATPLKECSNEPIRRSPQITSSLNELAFLQDNISHISISANTPPAARLPTRYQAVAYSPIYQPTPPIPGGAFQGIPVCNIGAVHTIQAPMTVFPTSPIPQVAPNMQQILVKKAAVGKAAGMAQGPNGVIQPIYPASMFASPIPSPSVSETCQPSEYRFATPPIPVRPSRVYGPFNQRGLNPTQQQMPFNYNMSPYQSPMDSPLTSPFTSPSPSPRSSPLPSPRLSPFPSPGDSPMFRKKFGGDRNFSRRNSEQLTSVFDWLKSLRLHKYSDTFKDYTFQDMKDLTDDDLEKLGLTKGATKKFKLHINDLIKRGFKGFGSQAAHQLEGGFHSSAGTNFDSPSYRRMSSSSDSTSVPVSSPVAVDKSLPVAEIPVSGHENFVPNYSEPRSPTAAQNTASECSVSSEIIKEEMRRELIRRGEEHFAEKSSEDGSQSTSEDLDESFSDEEVFMTRRPTVIENKDCQFNIASCYNCGSKEHCGDHCVEQTMEEETYLRYGYHLKYNDERLNEDGR